jgi:myosin heavy subunit
MLWRAICIVLQLGNLEFDVHPDKDDASTITLTEDLLALSTLMGIPLEDLTNLLTIRNVETGGEIFPVPLTPEKAKEIYAKAFLWLV